MIVATECIRLPELNPGTNDRFATDVEHAPDEIDDLPLRAFRVAFEEREIIHWVQTRTSMGRATPNARARMLDSRSSCPKFVYKSRTLHRIGSRKATTNIP